MFETLGTWLPEQFLVTVRPAMTGLCDFPHLRTPVLWRETCTLSHEPWLLGNTLFLMY